MAGLNDVEKLERFYLNSCTDLPSAARSMHQCFPTVSRKGDSETEDSSGRRSVSNHNFRRRSRSKIAHTNRANRNGEDDELESNNRVKKAFFKVYGSLLSCGGKPSKNQEKGFNNNEISTSDASDLNCDSMEHLPPAVSMSKEEFIQKFHCLVSEMKEKLEIKSPLPAISKAKFSASASSIKRVASKAAGLAAEKDRKGILTRVSRTGVKATISSTNRPSTPNQASSPVGHVIVIGLFVFVLIGLVKASASSESGSQSSSTFSALPRSFN